MASKQSATFLKYGAMLFLVLVLLGSMVSWFAPLLGNWLTAGFVLALWASILYLAILLVVISASLRASEKSVFSLKRVLSLRRQILILYSVIDVFVFSTGVRLRLSQGLIALNNHLLDAVHFKVKGSEVLVLTPHCIQSSKCGIKVTGEENYCDQCGMCSVGDLKTLKNKYGVEVAIATGGTLARLMIASKRPKLVIAVACERDLTSGIRDARSLPVYGIYNERPNGPCLDTRFDVSALETLLKDVVVSSV